MSNPFLNERGFGAVDTQSRLDLVKRFDLADCKAALALNGLQQTVEAAINRRIRKLEKEQA